MTSCGDKHECPTAEIALCLRLERQESTSYKLGFKEIVGHFKRHIICCCLLLLLLWLFLLLCRIALDREHLWAIFFPSRSDILMHLLLTLITCSCPPPPPPTHTHTHTLRPDIHFLFNTMMVLTRMKYFITFLLSV